MCLASNQRCEDILAGSHSFKWLFIARMVIIFDIFQIIPNVFTVTTNLKHISEEKNGKEEDLK